MAIRNLRLEGDEILKKKSREVDVIDEKIITLVNDMIETMHKYNGVGLAAVQVGILKRIVVIDLYEEGVEPYILINPEIVKTKGEQTVEEGCLSFPNKFAKIVRPKEVTVRALDEKGNKMSVLGSTEAAGYTHFLLGGKGYGKKISSIFQCQWNDKESV